MKTTMRYELVESRYGMEPSLRATYPDGTSYKKVMAELHKLTAAVYLAAERANVKYGWNPEPKIREDGTAAGRVRIELDKGTPDEIAIAERVLRGCIATKGV